MGLIVGAHGVFGEPLTIVSSSLPVMMVALGGAFGVHILAAFQRYRGSGKERASAVLRELWAPVFLSGMTTSVAFFALLVMPQVPMRRFGVSAGIGVLLLLVLALLVLPALLSFLPERGLRPRPERALKFSFSPPLWLAVALGLGGIALGSSMQAEPDVSKVFAEDSEVGRADSFFQTHFGGSTFVQVTIDGDLREAEVIRLLRDLGEEIVALDGVVEVRSVVDPVAVVNEGIGGRRGVPENSARANRVMTMLIGHPAMAQLMTHDADGAVIHVKLRPMSGVDQVELTRAIQGVVVRLAPTQTLRSASTALPAVAKLRRDAVRKRIASELGVPLTDVNSLEVVGEGAPSKALLAEVRKLLAEVLDSEAGAVAVPVPAEESRSISASELLAARHEKELETIFREKLPTLAEKDAEGITFAAEHLLAWIEEAKKKYRLDDYCVALAMEEHCARIKPILAELADARWRVPEGVEFQAEQAELRSLPVAVALTGQPVIGQAFAESVTRSLWLSTAVSLLALAMMLAVSRQLFALIPAAWTLACTVGIISLLGHPISVGTSMIACIALGAGVDFAIHLGVRARRSDASERGRAAVRELGMVISISALELAAAFAVLAGSTMLPLQHFGIGLAVAMLAAALGAIWLIPWLFRGTRKAEK